MGISLGVFGGGFKPFTMGHFSMLALAAEENDRAILLYGMSGRDTKGAEFEYTPDMARAIFEINEITLERELPNVKIVEAKPSPIAATFGIIKAFKDAVQPPEQLPEMLPSSYALDAAGIDPTSIDTLTIYDGPDDIARYMKYLADPEQSLKYFGTLPAAGRLRFDSGPGREDRGEKGMEAVVRKFDQKLGGADLLDRIRIRGTPLRRRVAAGAALEEFRRFIAPVYTDEEAAAIFSIMQRGIPRAENTNESLRALIRALVRG